MKWQQKLRLSLTPTEEELSLKNIKKIKEIIADFENEYHDLEK